MNILQIIAHPDTSNKSFTGQLAERFEAGAEEAGHSVISYNIYDRDYCPSIVDFKDLILEANHICFAWPCMWEMPPARLVEFFQSIFIKDFAFKLVNDKMKPLLQIPVTCLISMGQDKVLNTVNLSEAMAYCGLLPVFHLYTNVGPRLTPEEANLYLSEAKKLGKSL